jgi:hypothetical protein
MTVASALPHEEGPCVELDYFGRVPQSVWRRDDISFRAKGILGGLTVLALAKTGWIRGTLSEIAFECGCSTRTVQRGIAELVEQHVIEWESIGSNFVLKFRLRGPSLPRDSEAAATSCTHDNPVSAPTTTLSVHPRQPCRAPIIRERDKEPPDAKVGGGGDPPSVLPFNPTEPVGDEEFFAYLHSRANALLSFSVSMAEIRRAVARCGDLAVEVALDKIESSPVRPWSWGYVIVTAQGLNGEIPKRLQPKPPLATATQSSAGPGTEQENPDGGAPISETELLEFIGCYGHRPSAEKWIREGLEAGRIDPEIIPDRFRHLVPEPVAEAHENAGLGALSPNTPPGRPGASEPRDTSVPDASSVVLPTRAHEDPQPKDQYARQDSNLQPSAPKSEGRTTVDSIADVDVISKSRTQPKPVDTAHLLTSTASKKLIASADQASKSVVESIRKKTCVDSYTSFSDRNQPRPIERPSAYQTEGFSTPTGTEARPPIPLTSPGASPCAAVPLPSSRPRSFPSTGRR